LEKVGVFRVDMPLALAFSYRGELSGRNGRFKKPDPYTGS
jgi:hypothetical protein